MLGAGACDADRIGLLKCIGTNQMGRHLAGNAHHGNGIHQRIGQAGHRIGGTGAGSNKHNTAFAAGTGIALRRMGRALFVADENMLNIFLLEQFVINRQHSATRIAENMLHAIIAQRLQDDLSTVYLFFHRSIRALSRVSKELRAQTRPEFAKLAIFMSQSSSILK